jgi:trehalose 6-phosphate phosphatase
MFLFLDYDGTLVPIVRDPFRAFIDPKRKEFISRLSEKIPTAIVTGRSLKNLLKVFGEPPPHLYLITSHGALITKNGRTVHKSPASLPPLDLLREDLRKLGSGIILEEKEGCFAVHYRMAPNLEGKVREIFKDFIKEHPPLKVIEGKMVLEALYGDFDKGKGVLKLLELTGRRGNEVVYIGDDTTDLIAFEIVKKLGGECIFVGKPEHSKNADRVIPDVEGVYRFLSSLEETVDNH